MKVKIKKLNESAIIPSYAKNGDAGMDLTAVEFEIDKYGNKTYYTGLAMEIPEGYAGFIFPRSSISKKTLDLANAVGIIDSGYRGEIICKFKPTVHFTYAIDKLIIDDEYDIGDRIAQIIILPYPKIEFDEVKELSDTDRSDGGFGSTNN